MTANASRASGASQNSTFVLKPTRRCSQLVHYFLLSPPSPPPPSFPFLPFAPDAAPGAALRASEVENFSMTPRLRSSISPPSHSMRQVAPLDADAAAHWQPRNTRRGAARHGELAGAQRGFPRAQTAVRLTANFVLHIIQGRHVFG